MKKYRSFVADLLHLLHLDKLVKKPAAHKSPRQVTLEQLLGAELGNPHLYQQALTHRSYENVGNLRSNERLEFLGDSVVNLAVGDALFALYPEESEGVLTNIRSDYLRQLHCAY